MNQGPEDSKNWKTANESSPFYRENRKCHECKFVIDHYHCEETGCPWCANCGSKVTPPKKEKP